ncbi:hypothetical protein SETIT_6G088300v2 [Setaria italica]|uniref:Uncharacterized protein n=3 Tax=Setaria TaxID=4554 RepID=A0A368RJX0_SETIT|nr:uncharacterized protein LOC101754244 isoform X2 [Setaria italica]RCV30358.1 hypothetical protein SETIT_6G088300v2 [Setaria italica]
MDRATRRRPESFSSTRHGRRAPPPQRAVDGGGLLCPDEGDEIHGSPGILVGESMMAGILVVESTATRIHSSDGILGAQATRRPGSTQPPSSTAVQGPPVRWNQVLLALTNQSPWWRSRLDDLEFCTHDVAGRWCHLQELEPVFFKNISAYPKGSVQTSEKLKWLLKVPDLNESTSEVQQIMLESDVPNMIRTSAGVAHLRLQR